MRLRSAKTSNTPLSGGLAQHCVVHPRHTPIAPPILNVNIHGNPVPGVREISLLFTTTSSQTDPFPFKKVILPAQAKLVTTKATRECHNKRNGVHIFKKRRNNAAVIPQTPAQLSQNRAAIRKRRSRANAAVRRREQERRNDRGREQRREESEQEKYRRRAGRRRADAVRMARRNGRGAREDMGSCRYEYAVHTKVVCNTKTVYTHYLRQLAHNDDGAGGTEHRVDSQQNSATVVQGNERENDAVCDQGIF